MAMDLEEVEDAAPDSFRQNNGLPQLRDRCVLARTLKSPTLTVHCSEALEGRVTLLRSRPENVLDHESRRKVSCRLSSRVSAAISSRNSVGGVSRGARKVK